MVGFAIIGLLYPKQLSPLVVHRSPIHLGCQHIAYILSQLQRDLNLYKELVAMETSNKSRWRRSFPSASCHRDCHGASSSTIRCSYHCTASFSVIIRFIYHRCLCHFQQQHTIHSNSYYLHVPAPFIDHRWITLTIYPRFGLHRDFVHFQWLCLQRTHRNILSQHLNKILIVHSFHNGPTSSIVPLLSDCGTRLAPHHIHSQHYVVFDGHPRRSVITVFASCSFDGFPSHFVYRLVWLAVNSWDTIPLGNCYRHRLHQRLNLKLDWWSLWIFNVWCYSHRIPIHRILSITSLTFYSPHSIMTHFHCHRGLW